MQGGELVDNDCWANTWLGPILDAIGVKDADARGVRLHAEYGVFATATIYDKACKATTHLLTHFGTTWVSGVFNLPRGVQAITVDMFDGTFVIANVRFAPIDVSYISVVNALRGDLLNAEQENELRTWLDGVEGL